VTKLIGAQFGNLFVSKLRADNWFAPAPMNGRFVRTLCSRRRNCAHRGHWRDLLHLAQKSRKNLAGVETGRLKMQMSTTRKTFVLIGATG